MPGPRKAQDRLEGPHETNAVADEHSVVRAPANAVTWLGACGGALVLACFYYYWSQCVLAEIYATAALLLAALLYAAVSWRLTR